MTTCTIYLGGAFAQFTAAYVESKQAEIQAMLPAHITCLKPQHRDAYPATLGAENIGNILTTRDYEQIKRADLLVLDMLEAKTVSGGSFIEIGWASEMKKPVVMIAEENNPHRHIMAMNLITAAVTTRAQAAEVITKILSH